MSAKVSSYYPRVSTRSADWTHIQDLTLADPWYSQTGVIDLLLGVSVYSQIIEKGLIKGQPGTPIATKSQLGWLLSGDTLVELQDNDVIASMHCSAQDELIELMQRFWKSEETQCEIRPKDHDDAA